MRRLQMERTHCSIRLVAGTIAMITYGHQVTEKNDSIVRSIERVVDFAVSIGSPGATIIDFVPIRVSSLSECIAEAYDWVVQYVPAWVPWIRFKKHLIEGRDAVVEAGTVPYEKVRRERVCSHLIYVIYINNT